ncbi:hypothetical protein [Aquimarina sp. 2201CG5-10]|uniref:hypothetical protein n=1 Tax=Aquimarina callyspongiae TaxID=3098150 RepID=UPI002AB3E855|nr:hypothetical protein [Aquimarina sp. 2201CG5-10]MDY8136488.1 hypothetical protein [Aquimarina sp. 2201CG5-10]
MAPLKFEDKMKEKLEQRAIQPSKDSWERLSSQLDEHQNQKKGDRKFWRYAVAASIVGILIITSIFFNDNQTPVEENKQFVDVNDREHKEKVNNTDIVESENRNQKNKEAKQESLFNEELITKNEIKNNPVNQISENNTTRIKKNNSDSKKSNTSKVVEEKETIIAESTKEASINANQEPEKNLIDAKMIEDKVANVVAQVEELQKNNIEVTDEEINRMLLDAQREITTKKILKSNTVSASALLQDVEEELDETFKNRVFEALKTGFQKVRTAVAERNQ